MAQQKKTKRKAAVGPISSSGLHKSASKFKPSQTSKAEASKSKTPLSKAKVSKSSKRSNPKGIITTFVIVVFAVVMALSMMLPSFATVFASNQSSNTNSSSGNSSSDDTSDNSSTTNTESVDGVFSNYASEIADLENKLADDPDNLAYLYNVGKTYMDCAYSASQYASGDTDTEKVDEYYQTAMSYFDRYLALNDSDAVKVDRALCQLYEGDVSSSVAAFEQITTDSPDYAPAWANLGLAYETSGETTSAVNAYNEAKQTDPNDEYGAYSFAVTRLSYIQSESSSSNSTTSNTTTSNSSSTSSSSTSSNTSNSSSTTGVQGLSNALSGNTTSSSE